MQLRERSLLSATLLLVILSAFTFSTKTGTAQSEVVIYVSPDTVSVAPGESFDIAVNIKRAENVYSWQVSLSWNPTVLELQEVSEGNFLNQGIFPTIWSEDNYVDNDAGNGTLFCILRGQPRSSSASGDGTLATVTFYVKDDGYTALPLYNTELLDYDYYELPHTSESGVFQSSQAEIPLLRVELPSIENPLTVNSTFDANITIVNVANLYSWTVCLSWDPTVLNATDVHEGPFLSQDGTQATTFNVTYPEAGVVCVNCTLVSQPIVTAGGNGTLATITFSVENYGITLLDLHNTTLLDSNLMEIPHLSEDSYFINVIGVVPILHVNLPTMEDNLTIGFTFDANITIVNVANLYSWTVCLSWDPTVLNATDVHEGPFLSQDGTQATTFNVTYPEAGVVCVNCTLVSQPIVTAGGNGTLATITFSVENYGITLLDLHNTTLLDSNLMEIPHLSEDSYFTYPMLGDISVKSIEASIYNVTIGDSVSITIIVENQGNVEEPFDVLVWANITLVRIIPVTDLELGDQKTLTLDWSTQNITEGTYVIKAEADTVLGETDIDDNTLVMANVIHATAQSDTQFPTTLVIAAVAIIVLLAIILFYFTRRKRSPKK
jgi:hypothetical protein